MEIYLQRYRHNLANGITNERVKLDERFKYLVGIVIGKHNLHATEGLKISLDAGGRKIFDEISYQFLLLKDREISIKNAALPIKGVASGSMANVVFNFKYISTMTPFVDLTFVLSNVEPREEFYYKQNVIDGIASQQTINSNFQMPSDFENLKGFALLPQLNADIDTLEDTLSLVILSQSFIDNVLVNNFKYQNNCPAVERFFEINNKANELDFTINAISTPQSRAYNVLFQLNKYVPISVR